MTKSEARDILAEIIRNLPPHSDKLTLGTFLDRDFFPVFNRRWKPSTRSTTSNRIESHIKKSLGPRALSEITRAELQGFIDSKAAAKLSHSVIKHLRWDLNQIFAFAKSEQRISGNPAEMLSVPEGFRGERRVMTARDVALMLSALELPASLVVRLATLSAMRPGEIFALQWHHYRETHVAIDQRLYGKLIDSTKTVKSKRLAAVSRATQYAFESWRSKLASSEPEDWVFPSELLSRPETPWNLFRRAIRPALRRVGLGWVTFQVMRRTHASLMRELGQDAKAVADQLGHTLDVDLNVYTQTSVEYRGAALETLESAIEKEISRQ